MTRTLWLRTRGEDGTAARVAREWDPARAAMVICDMWDAHQCVTAAQRVLEMAPRVNEVAAALREQGALIIHAPHDCMAFYRDTPARRRAQEAPSAPAPVAFDWIGWHRDPHAAELPQSLTHPDPCPCRTADPCSLEPPVPWTRQTPLIEVREEDAVSDDGPEIFNLLEERGIDDVFVTGVHSNVCVLSRPYGIRQLVMLGKRPVLCRDLTDAFHRDPRGHAWGCEAVIAHIERHWCPTVTSDQLAGGAPFRFSAYA